MVSSVSLALVKEISYERNNQFLVAATMNMDNPEKVEVLTAIQLFTYLKLPISAEDIKQEQAVKAPP